MQKPEKVEIQYLGRKAVGTPIGFKSLSPDQPISFQLDDGTRLEIRYMLVQVLRLDGEYNADGDPLYLFRQGSVPTTICPPELKRPSNEP